MIIDEVFDFFNRSLQVALESTSNFHVEVGSQRFFPPLCVMAVVAYFVIPRPVRSLPIEVHSVCSDLAVVARPDSLFQLPASILVHVAHTHRISTADLRIADRTLYEQLRLPGRCGCPSADYGVAGFSESQFRTHEEFDAAARDF